MENVFEVDVHGMTQIQAQAVIDAKLKNLPGTAGRLRVIHGYHGGTAIRDMVRKRYTGNKRVLRIEVSLNPGETDLVLK